MRVFAKGLLPHSGPQVTMAMKTKKERFHVGALNQDLEGEMSRRGEEEEGCGLQNALLNFTSHRVGGKMHRERERRGGGVETGYTLPE